MRRPWAEWSDEELQESVRHYLVMLGKQQRAEPFVKKVVYEDLALRFDRSPNAFERRMMNISYLLHEAGLEWVKGLAPGSHIGANIAVRLIPMLVAAGVNLGDVGAGTPVPPTLSGAPMPDAPPAVGGDAPRTELRPPAGASNPSATLETRVTYARDEGVKRWVLNRAAGNCECCRAPAPFLDSSGAPFLEVHHLRQLAHGGSDRVSNAVAVCPNCHRRLHHGADALVLLAAMYNNIPELVPEYSEAAGKPLSDLTDPPSISTSR